MAKTPLPVCAFVCVCVCLCVWGGGWVVGVCVYAYDQTPPTPLDDSSSYLVKYRYDPDG